MTNRDASLVLSRHVEPRLIKICIEEGLLKLSEMYLTEMGPRLDVSVSQADRSQIFASTFLCPSVSVDLFGHSEVVDQEALISFRAEPHKDDDSDDTPTDFVNIVSAYAIGIQPDLTPDKIESLMTEFLTRREDVIERFGAMPSSDGNGDPVFISETIRSVIARTPRPVYPAANVEAFKAYSRARGNAHNIISCAEDIGRIWTNRRATDHIAIHPAISRSYNQILNTTDIDKISNDEEIFFLAIRELQTLPVGRTLRETLELAQTEPGIALRARIRELSEMLSDGSPAGVAAVLQAIRAEVDDYRSLTARLQSPHYLSKVTDIALNLGGLVPVLGTLTGVGALAKSATEFAADRRAREALNSIAWTEYKGTSI